MTITPDYQRLLEAEPPTIGLRRVLSTNDVVCETCGVAVWQEQTDNSPTEAMFKHVRSTHIPEGVIVSRFAEPTGHGDYAVMQFRRETEAELQNRADAWMRQHPTDAHELACEIAAVYARIGDHEQADVYASIGRALSRNGSCR